MAEFQDIIETSETAPLLVWWQWVLIFFAAAIAIVIAILLLRKLKHSTKAPETNLEIALSKLNSLSLENTNSNQLASDLSVIVREYLQVQFGDKALFETDEEFHERAEQIEALPAQAAEKLRSYLSDLSQHKYAPNHNHPAALENFVSKANELLRGIDSTVPRPLSSG
jgi:hypothetical protein